MDFILYRLDPETGERVALEHGEQNRFHTPGEAEAAAQERRDKAARSGAAPLPAFVIVDAPTGEPISQVGEPERKPLKTWRVRWVEEYSRDVEAISAEDAREQAQLAGGHALGRRDISAEEICGACKGDGCPTCEGRGSREAGA